MRQRIPYALVPVAALLIALTEVTVPYWSEGPGPAKEVEPLIQQQPGPGSLFPIHEGHAGIDYILDRSDRFGITRSNEQAFFPSRECHDLIVRTFQCSPEEWQVRLPGRRIEEMQTCDMNLALLQGSKRRHTSHRPADQ